MSDITLVKELLSQLIDAASKVLIRSEPIGHADDFTGTSAGLEKLDAICM